MGTGLAEHLLTPHSPGIPADAEHTGAAGGAACGDVVRIGVRVEQDRVADAGFEASGCAAARAAGSAVAALADGLPLLDAARVTTEDVMRALDGISPAGRHGVELATDALHRALGAALRDGAPALARSTRRTLVAMSGGVDSAVAAHLAVAAGEEVVAVTLELWSDPATDGTLSCCSPQAVVGARALAHSMGLAHFTLDVRERFRAEVVDDFLAEYAGGRTPNPCVRCNGLVRFDAMLAAAGALGAARLATGHYARVTQDSQGPLLRAAADPRKDQSYMLARLGPGELERLSFPLGEISKDRVRELAREAGLPVADKRESQDLCFVAGMGTRRFMRRHGGASVDLAAEGGDIVAEDGTVLGRHAGHHHFTVGQRRGIGVAAEEPLYVIAKEAAGNRVVVGPRSRLARNRVRIRGASLHRDAATVDGVRLRYRSSPVPCRVADRRAAGSHSLLELELGGSVEAVAPGQTACLLSGDRVVGAGVVAEEGS
jgi:tRNA-uridine 2-sulfurtransferase